MLGYRPSFGKIPIDLNLALSRGHCASPSTNVKLLSDAVYAMNVGDASRLEKKLHDSQRRGWIGDFLSCSDVNDSKGWHLAKKILDCAILVATSMNVEEGR